MRAAIPKRGTDEATDCDIARAEETTVLAKGEICGEDRHVHKGSWRLCDDTATQTGPVHVPMSLWARTAAQGESSSTHVPMSLIGRGPLCRRIV